jgi:hypothetical protein
MLWLLASESVDGSFDGSPEEIEFRTRMPLKEVQSSLKELISKGFFVDASNMLAECLQDAIPETERERETEGEKETKFAPLNALIAHGVDQDVAKDFLAVRRAKKAPLTKTALSGIINQSSEAGMTLQQALETCVQRNWQSFKAEWITKDQPQPAPVRNYL